MKDSVKGLIFDYGGTLDTNGVHWSEVIYKHYVANHVKVDKDSYREAFVAVERLFGRKPLVKPFFNFKATLHLKLRHQFNVLGLSDMKLALQVADDSYEEAKAYVNTAKKTLAKLKEKYPMVLVSNFYGNLHSVLKDFELLDYFDAVVESAIVGIRKPDPAIFELGMKELGNMKPEEVVIIGDSYKNDIHPAILLGCHSIWLKGQGWDDRDKDIKHPAIIKNIAEIESYLL